MIRRGDFKYNYYKSDTAELYDLRKDPFGNAQSGRLAGVSGQSGRNAGPALQVASAGIKSGAALSHNGDMVTLNELRGERREEILPAGRRGARNVRVFGSVARGEANESSDLDLLVAWEPGRSLLDHAGLVEDLQELLGMKVHVGTENPLHWYVRERILREARPL